MPEREQRTALRASPPTASRVDAYAPDDVDRQIALLLASTGVVGPATGARAYPPPGFREPPASAPAERGRAFGTTRRVLLEVLYVIACIVGGILSTYMLAR